MLILGGGSPKNFILQTEPQIQEVLGLSESGHDYFLQVTDARPDTGGLSGATASEAMTWGKVDPDTLARLGDLLHRLDHRAAAPDRLRPRSPRPAPATAVVRSASQALRDRSGSSTKSGCDRTDKQHRRARSPLLDPKD